MASINDIYAELKNMESAIVSKGGKMVKANTNPSLAELINGIQSIHTTQENIVFQRTTPKTIITAELPNVTINLKAPDGNVLQSLTTGSTGGRVEFSTNLVGVHTLEAIGDNDEKIWDAEVNVEDKNVYYVKTGKKFNDYTWAEIKQAADGDYARYMWSIFDRKILNQWMGIDLTLPKNIFPECYNDESIDSSFHQVMIIAFGGDLKSDGTGRTGLTLTFISLDWLYAYNHKSPWKTLNERIESDTFESAAGLTSTSNSYIMIDNSRISFSTNHWDYPSDWVLDWPAAQSNSSYKVGYQTYNSSSYNYTALQHQTWPCSFYRYLVAPKGDYIYMWANVNSSTSGTYYIYDTASGDYIAKTLPAEYDLTLAPYYTRTTMREDGPALRCLPDDLRAVLSKVRKSTYLGYVPPSYRALTAPMVETNDYLWIPSYNECYGEWMPTYTQKDSYKTLPTGTSTQTREYYRLQTFDETTQFDNCKELTSFPTDWPMRYYSNQEYYYHTSYGKDSTYAQKETHSTYGYLYKGSTNLYMSFGTAGNPGGPTIATRDRYYTGSYAVNADGEVTTFSTPNYSASPGYGALYHILRPWAVKTGYFQTNDTLNNSSNHSYGSMYDYRMLVGDDKKNAAKTTIYHTQGSITSYCITPCLPWFNLAYVANSSYPSINYFFSI